MVGEARSHRGARFSLNRFAVHHASGCPVWHPLEGRVKKNAEDKAIEKAVGKENERSTPRRPDANLKLSQARAEAVKQALTSEYGVSDGQLTAKGYGDTKPSAENGTPEGRANNRRVELVKS